MVTNIGMSNEDLRAGLPVVVEFERISDELACRSPVQPRRDAVSTAPASGVRVVDTTDGLANFAGLLLADLGADVILVEPPEGVPPRTAADHRRASLSFSCATPTSAPWSSTPQRPRGQQQLSTCSVVRRVDRHQVLTLTWSRCRPHDCSSSSSPSTVRRTRALAACRRAIPSCSHRAACCRSSRIKGRPPLLPRADRLRRRRRQRRRTSLVGLWNRWAGAVEALQLSLHEEAMVQAGRRRAVRRAALVPGVRWRTRRTDYRRPRAHQAAPSRHTQAMLAWLGEAG